MYRRVLAGALALAFLAAAAAAFPASAGASQTAVCGRAEPRHVRCFAHVRTDVGSRPFSAAKPAGYTPSDLRSAYAAPDGGAGRTIAIVDAYDAPSAEADLGVYRGQFGLPPCTSASGCFRKVDQTGGPKPPRADAGWAEEVSLDVDMASTMCPKCSLLLVEASTTSVDDLGTAVDTAARLGATVVSNSYGGDEFSGELTASRHYDHRGVVVTASSGDNGYGVSFPASTAAVLAVGGTSLSRSGAAGGGRGWIESAWTGAGSGCSAYVPKPVWQKDPGCKKRAVADVAAVADPDTGVAVYDSYPSSGQAGWMVFGGTSASAPIVAGLVAAAPASAGAAYLYAHQKGNVNDVRSGSNGTCRVRYLCTAGAGYDGPTGLGTPKGAGAL